MSGRYTYPVTLDVHGRRCVVVGGGAVGGERAAGLADAGADVVVVDPGPGGPVRDLAARRAVELVLRAYRDGDLAGAFLAVAATGDRATDDAVTGEARARGVLLNAAAGGRGDLSLPSVVRRGPVTVAVSTGGLAPGLAAALRGRIEPLVPPAVGRLAELAAALPGRVRGRGHGARWRRLLDPALLAGLDAGRDDEARAAVAAVLTPGTTAGVVSLVGAGPGDPGLLTLAGWDRLARADAVVYDRLVDPALLELAPADAERVYIGKAYGRHVVEQEDLNAMLVDMGRRGLRVVRLKGGDPFVFGRGGEEADALVEAGVPFEVVPGVSSAVAVPAYAGIPVTDRRYASSVTVVTGHRDPGDPDSTVDWAHLAAAGGTLVVLMGVHRIEAVAAALLRHGRDPATPAAVVERGTMPGQRILEAPLCSVAGAARAAAVQPPALLVVGDVVRLRERLAWFVPGAGA